MFPRTDCEQNIDAKQMHGRVFSGMRWAFWLSALAAPFGAATNLLLARVSPEVIGVYGLLSVYVGLFTSLLYFGGDAVIIRFIPEAEQRDRVPFLFSYGGINLLYLALFVAIVWLWPQLVSSFLGSTIDQHTAVLLVCMAPVPIFFQMAIAALKGLLEITASQLLAKSLTLLSFVCYGALVAVKQSLLIEHPWLLLWGIYFGCAAGLAVFAVFRICRTCSLASLHFYLPKRFWRYALDTQAVSVANFLSGRLDYTLIAGLAGIETLGRYVAIMVFATSLTLVASLFMDTLLPSLLNMLAAQNKEGAIQVFLTHMRILFLVVVLGSCFLIAFAPNIVRLMGASYSDLAALLIAGILPLSLAVPGAYGGTLLASVDQQRLAIWANLLKALIFCAMFFSLRRLNLLYAAVLANGLATLGSSVTLIVLARACAPFYPSIINLWISAACVECTVATIALYRLPLEPAAATGIWLLSAAFFMYFGGYRLPELRQLFQIYLIRSGPPPPPREPARS